MPHCSFDLHFSNNQPYGASFHALDGKKPFFTGKKIKNEWQLPECLGSISPHTRYSSCTWLWLWPQKTEGNQRPMKSSNVVIMRKLETSPFGFESWSFSLIMAASWKSVFNSYQPFTVRQSDSNLNLYSTLGQLVSKSTPWPWQRQSWLLLPSGASINRWLQEISEQGLQVLPSQESCVEVLVLRWLPLRLRPSHKTYWQWLCVISCLPFPVSASLIAQLVKNLPAMQETPVWFLGQEDLL